MKILEHLTAPAILVMAFAVNAFHNHTALGSRLGHVPGLYPIVFFIGIGVVLPALALGRTVRREPMAARPLGVALDRRDLIAVLAALVIGCVLAARPLLPILAQPGGTARVAMLFVQLLVASTAEVALFLGAMGMGLRVWLGGRHDWRFGLVLIAISSLIFGLFHFTYPAPWNTIGTAVTVGIVWIAVAALFVATRSLVAVVLIDNIMATVGFATRDLVLPLSMTMAGLIEVAAVAAFVAAFTWSRRDGAPSGLGATR